MNSSQHVESEAGHFAQLPLSPRHLAMLRAIASGERVGQVAQQFGCSRKTVSRLVHSEAGRDWLNDFHFETTAEILRALVVGPMIAFRRAAV